MILESPRRREGRAARLTIGVWILPLMDDDLSATSLPVDNVLRLQGGLQLAYREWGGEGHPILLVHGLASSYRIWDFVGPRLARRFRVIALDQRGHGRSDRPEASFEFATYVADLREFMDLLGLD